MAVFVKPSSIRIGGYKPACGYLSGQPSHPFVRVADGSPAENSSTMAAARKKKADHRHAREALAQDNLYPRIAALSRRVPRSEKV